MDKSLYNTGRIGICIYCGQKSTNCNRCEMCHRKCVQNIRTRPVSSSVCAKSQEKNAIPVNIFYSHTSQNPKKISKQHRFQGISPKKPIYKKPESTVIVINSSDEEEVDQLKKVRTSKNMNFNDNEKWKDINDRTIDVVMNTSQTSIKCRTIRIGTYKYVPKDEITITSNGIRLNVPLIDDEKCTMLEIKFHDIIKVLIDFEKIIPVIFFYTSISSGVTIRKLLGMRDPTGLYYDPSSKDHKHRSIFLLPQKISKELKCVLKQIFKYKIEDMNVRKSRKAFSSLSKNNTTITKQQSQFATATNPNTIHESQRLLLYSGIPINVTDYCTLGMGRFLSGDIINFYFKYLTLEVLSPTDRDRTHVFSTYFYTRLTDRYDQSKEGVMSLTSMEDRHARVKKWTKNVNIFEKDFIIIPIHKNCHWFLAIICFPDLVGKDSCTGCDEEMVIDSDKNMINMKKENVNPQPNTESLSAVQKIIKKPCILIFNSLATSSQMYVASILRDYLQCEYLAKMSAKKLFSKDTIKSSAVEVPQQPNFTDCGLYVLQYVESFFKDPIKNYTLPIKSMKNWFEEIVVIRKREELSKLLIKLVDGDKNITLPKLDFPKT